MMDLKNIHSVCIIDDDPIFIYGTKRIIKDLDFCSEIIIFNNGQEAIDGLKNLENNGENLPEVIFLDLNMPIMNGWEFLEDFTKLPPQNREQVTIYIISSSIDPRDLERIQDYKEVNNYILKPLSQEDLVDVLREVA